MEQFDYFLNAAGPTHKDFAAELNDILVKRGCKVNIQKKATGFFVAYAHPKTKKSIFNFYFRKNGLYVRLYPKAYKGAVLTDDMNEAIKSAPDCKRLTGTAECNPKCSMGYDFELKGDRYQKCRLAAFQFLLDGDNKFAILKWVTEELL